MPASKDPATIAAKWARVTPGRAGEYEQGIKNPRTSWSTATGRAASNYNQAVTAAIAAKSFEKGVTKAGDAAWQSGALSKGPARFAEGVSIAEPDYQAAVAPYIAVINSTALPERFPRGDPRNIKRVEAIATALRKKKMGT